MISDRDQVSIKAVIFRGAGEGIEVLLLRSYNRGLWDLPGGRREGNESAIQAVIREVLEETALSVSNGKWIQSGEITLTPPWIPHEKTVAIETYLFHANDDRNAATISIEHPEARWVNVCDVPGMTYIPAVYRHAIMTALLSIRSIGDSGPFSVTSDSSHLIREKYNEHGFVIVKGAITSSQARDISLAIENEFARPGNQIKTFLPYLDRSIEPLSAVRAIVGVHALSDSRRSMVAARNTSGNHHALLDAPSPFSDDSLRYLLALKDTCPYSGGFCARVEGGSLRIVPLDAGDWIIYSSGLPISSILPSDGLVTYDIRGGYSV